MVKVLKCYCFFHNFHRCAVPGLDFGLALFEGGEVGGGEGGQDLCHIGHRFLQIMSGFGMYVFSINTDLTIGSLCSSFILESVSHSNRINRKKPYLLFSKLKMGNWEQGWSQVTFFNTETSANQF